MKFCLHFGNITLPNPEDARRIMQAAEAAGFESVIAVEHVVIPTNYKTEYPYSESGRLPGGVDMALGAMNFREVLRIDKMHKYFKINMNRAYSLISKPGEYRAWTQSPVSAGIS